MNEFPNDGWETLAIFCILVLSGFATGLLLELGYYGYLSTL